MRVEPKVMGVLVALSRRPGQLVTREELFEEVWTGTVVTEDVLTRSISELRKVFGDDPKSPRYIETIPKTGYRLVAPLSVGPFGDSVPGGRQAPGADEARTASRWRNAKMAVLGLAVILVVLVVGAVWGLRSPSERPGAPIYAVPVTTYPGRESAPELSPDGERVAFSWQGEAQDNTDVYVKYVDAAPVLRLTTGSSRDRNPAWSPDGTEIAFMSRDGDCRIRVVSAIGGTPRPVGSCGASIYGDLTWSPDGAWLAFNDRDPRDEAFAIYLMSPATGEKRRLTHPPAGIWGDHDPVFSPEGQVDCIRTERQ